MQATYNTLASNFLEDENPTEKKSYCLEYQTHQRHCNLAIMAQRADFGQTKADETLIFHLGYKCV
jgi:hypothetical protein